MQILSIDIGYINMGLAMTKDNNVTFIKKVSLEDYIFK
jgi:hypothetical protein